jgi:hypothetical protein
LVISRDNGKGYTLKEAVIRYKGRVWIRNNIVAQRDILIALHDSGVGGHSGIGATYVRVKQLFHWPGMKQFIHDFVKQCQVCQQAKTERIKTPGLLEPLPMPTQDWETVSLNFIE